jgi:membrane-bound lytic murein transglycosylase D
LIAIPPAANGFPVELNDAVEDALAHYAGQPHIAAALSRGAKYLPRITEIFREHGLPPELAYVALVESEFRPRAESWARARGVWQFMPLTGERFGLEQTTWIDERSNPEKATHAAARYLKILHRTFGDWNLALAAYNAGEGRIMRALEETGAGDFWALAALPTLARETRDYVPRIHAAILLARDPARYGIEVTPEAPVATEAVPINQPTDLGVIAECIDTDVDVIEQLNPELRRPITPVGQQFALEVPEGTAPQLVECLTTVRERARVHTVRRGQTLSKLAKIYGTEVETLAEANDMSRSDALRPGMQLVIPAD